MKDITISMTHYLYAVTAGPHPPVDCCSSIVSTATGLRQYGHTLVVTFQAATFGPVDSWML